MGVPVFSGSVLVSYSLQIPTSTPTFTLGSSPTLPAGVAFWDDFDPVKETRTHYAAQGVDDWRLSTAYPHSSAHAYFSGDTSSIKDDYLLTRLRRASGSSALVLAHLPTGGRRRWRNDRDLD